MATSLGYHTMEISMGLTQEEADPIFNDFKAYQTKTNEIKIVKEKTFKADPYGRHYSVIYPKTYKGIKWRIRFSSTGFLLNDKFITCSVKAVINPKILVGEKSFIVAANADYINGIVEEFNLEARKISRRLKDFYYYSLNRIDYCINFDVDGLKVISPESRKGQIPELIMELINHGDIPTHYKRIYDNPNQFYLKSGSVVINCYWKYDQLFNSFYDCPDLENSRNIIRFEVQFKYPKTYNVTKCIKSEISKFPDQFSRESSSLLLLENMLSDEKCLDTIEDYYFKTIKRGDYYTFDKARRKIEKEVSKWEKAHRLIDALSLIDKSEGISQAKSILTGKAEEDFRHSLRDLSELNINPVTIPKEWDIEYIPNLFNLYFDCVAAEQKKESNEKFRKEIQEEMFKKEQQ